MSSEELAARLRRRRVLIAVVVAVVALAVYAGREVVDEWSSTPSFAVTSIDGVGTVLANPCGMQLHRVWLTVERRTPVDPGTVELGDLAPAPVEGSDVLRFPLAAVDDALIVAVQEADPDQYDLRLHYEASSPLQRASGFVTLPDPPWPEYPTALDPPGDEVTVEELETC